MKKLILALMIIFFSLSLTSCNNNNYEIFNSLSLFHDDLLAVEKQGEWGYINTNGDIIIDFIYDEASAFFKGTAVVKKDNMASLIDTSGNKLLENDYENIYKDPKTDLIIYEIDDKYGLINQDGEVLIGAIYDHISPFNEGYAVVYTEDTDDVYNSTFGFIDESGEIVIEQVYDYATNFVDGVALVKEDNEYTYINKKGKQVFSDTYELAYSFDTFGVALVEKEGVDGQLLIDTKGRTILTGDQISVQYAPYYIVKDKALDEYTVYSQKGEQIIDTSFTKSYGCYFDVCYFEDSEDEYTYWLDNDRVILSKTGYLNGMKIDLSEVDLLAYYDFELSNYYSFSMLNQLGNNSDEMVFNFDETLNETTVYTKDETFTVSDGLLQQYLSEDKYILRDNNLIYLRDEGSSNLMDYDQLIYTFDNYYIGSIAGKIGILDENLNLLIDFDYDDIYISFNLRMYSVYIGFFDYFYFF